MSEDPQFDRSMPAAGRAEAIARRVRRIVASNAGPFTFTGTCSYIVGEKTLAVIDPGPDDPEHIDAILAATRGETIKAILVTHTHRDHSPGTRALVAATGARTFSAGPHRPARDRALGAVAGLDAASDLDFVPDVFVGDGETIDGPDWALRALATPGHCANHLAYALEGEEILFTGDHVMAWSTSIVAPPDGSMADYMASLGRLIGRPEQTYLPGHGAPVAEPQRFVRALIHHRRMREAAILQVLTEAPMTIPEIVARVYVGLAPGLAGAAGLNTFSQLEYLVDRGMVTASPRPDLTASWSVVS